MVSEVEHVSRIEVETAKDQTERIRELPTSSSTVTGMQQISGVVVSSESSCLIAVIYHSSITHALLMMMMMMMRCVVVSTSRMYTPLRKPRIDTAPLD